MESIHLGDILLDPLVNTAGFAVTRNTLQLPTASFIEREQQHT